MLAQLIQALYNIVDSVFVGRFSDSGLTALSIIYPIQLLMIALAVGTFVGINTVMAAKLGLDQKEKAKEYAGVGTPLAVALWIIFAAECYAIMPAFARMSTNDPAIISDVITYGKIVCVFSFGLFLESIWTKILQAQGDMKTPMVAQILGAVTNIILDPLLIFGLFGLPRMDIAGAAVATIAGQVVAALVVMKKGFHRSPVLKKYPHSTIFGGINASEKTNGDKNGIKSPTINDFFIRTHMEHLLDDFEIKTTSTNLEDIYSELYENPKYKDKLGVLDDAIYDYFSKLRLPDEPTIYDLLILGLTKDDLIATFNWDPLLIQAYERCYLITDNLPQMAFLHGNVALGYCPDCLDYGDVNNDCPTCGKKFERSKLLFSIKNKDYNNHELIKGFWEGTQDYIRTASKTAP